MCEYFPQDEKMAMFQSTFGILVNSFTFIVIIFLMMGTSL